MKTQKFEITIKSEDGFIDMSPNMAEVIETWLKENNKDEEGKPIEVDVDAEYMGEEDED